jgi:hypothetical protein
MRSSAFVSLDNAFGKDDSLQEKVGRLQITETTEV